MHGNITKRPFAITILCGVSALGLVGILLSDLLFLINPSIFPAKHYLLERGFWYLAISLLLDFLWLPAVIGLWRMKRWSAYTYIALSLLGLFRIHPNATSTQIYTLYATVAITAGIILFYYKKTT